MPHIANSGVHAKWGCGASGAQVLNLFTIALYSPLKQHKPSCQFLRYLVKSTFSGIDWERD